MQHESHSGIRRGLKASAVAILDLGWCGAAPRVQDVQPMRPIVIVFVDVFVHAVSPTFQFRNHQKQMITDGWNMLESIFFIHDKNDKRPVVKSIRFLADLFLSPC